MEEGKKEEEEEEEEEEGSEEGTEVEEEVMGTTTRVFVRSLATNQVSEGGREEGREGWLRNMKRKHLLIHNLSSLDCLRFLFVVPSTLKLRQMGRRKRTAWY